MSNDYNIYEKKNIENGMTIPYYMYINYVPYKYKRFCDELGYVARIYKLPSTFLSKKLLKFFTENHNLSNQDIIITENDKKSKNKIKHVLSFHILNEDIKSYITIIDDVMYRKHSIIIICSDVYQTIFLENIIENIVINSIVEIGEMYKKQKEKIIKNNKKHNEVDNKYPQIINKHDEIIEETYDDEKINTIFSRKKINFLNDVQLRLNDNI